MRIQYNYYKKRFIKIRKGENEKMSKSIRNLAIMYGVTNMYGKLDRFFNTQQCGETYCPNNSKKTKPQNKSFKRKDK